MQGLHDEERVYSVDREDGRRHIIIPWEGKMDPVATSQSERLSDDGVGDLVGLGVLALGFLGFISFIGYQTFSAAVVFLS